MFLGLRKGTRQPENGEAKHAEGKAPGPAEPVAQMTEEDAAKRRTEHGDGRIGGEPRPRGGAGEGLAHEGSGNRQGCEWHQSQLYPGEEPAEETRTQYNPFAGS